MSCEPAGLLAASSPSPSRMRSTHGATPDSTRRPVTDRSCGAVVEGDLGAVGAGRDRADAGVGDDLRARLDRGPRERVGDRAHAADRHAPLAGAVADQVVEEAAVLDERRVVAARRRCR